MDLRKPVALCVLFTLGLLPPGLASPRAEETAATATAAESARPCETTDSTGTNPVDMTREEIIEWLKALTDELRLTRQELEQLKKEREADKAAVAAEKNAAPAIVKPSPPAETIPSPATETAAASPAVPPPRPPADAPTADDRAEVEESLDDAQLARERAIRSVVRSGVLLRRNRFEVEPEFSYSHYSSNVINVDGFAILPVLVVGEIQSVRIERDIVQAAMNFRYGLFNNLQLDASVPYKMQFERFVRQVEDLPRTEEKRFEHGLGDVQFGVSWQALYEHGNVPDLILFARARAPTGQSLFDIEEGEVPLGTGVWGIRGGFTAIKALDPVVLILSGAYTHNLGRDIDIQVTDGNTTSKVSTDYIPGASAEYGVAVALAMNPTFALNFGVLQRFTFETELEGIDEIEGTFLNEAELRFGFGWALTRNMVFNFTAAAGLTEDTADLSIIMTLPIKF